MLPTRFVSFLAVVLSASSSIDAFSVILGRSSTTWASTTTALNRQKLSDIDLMAIENVAELCLHAEDALADECDLEEHEALVNQIQDQRDIMMEQINYMDDLLGRLKGHNVNGASLSP